jgi:exosome complex RNA-binding protein Csl4
MDIAIKYAMDKFTEAKKTVAKDGIVTVTDNQIKYIAIDNNQIKYIIDPAKIVVGLIDDDENEDAIITISSINGQYLEMPEHLILIKTDGKLMLNRVIESNMKVLGLKDRVITAEVSTRSLNSPLRDCSECKEVVKYQFRAGDLVRME